jgi:hypothetical protein
MDNKPWLTSLTFVGFNLTAALDHGHAASVTFEDVYRGLENGTLFEDLNEKLPGVFDFSLFREGPQRERLLEVLQQAAGGLEGRERRKTGVENSGLALLVAFIFEAIQAHYWTES